MRHESATIPPLAFDSRSRGAAAQGQTRDPFSDANAIGVAGGKGSGPATYVQDLRRSRGRSVSADNGSGNNNGNSGNYNYPFRESVSSVGSSRRTSSVGNAAGNGASSVGKNAAYYSALFNKRSTKFRSDPFDLDRPELLSSSSRDGSRDISSGAGASLGVGIGGGAGGNYATMATAPPMPAPMTAHLRGASYASWTSKYSSVSEDGAGDGAGFDLWSEPGPDVGPAAAKASAAAAPGKALDSGKRTSQTSQRSQTSVGKAL